MKKQFLIIATVLFSFSLGFFSCSDDEDGYVWLLEGIYDSEYGALKKCEYDAFNRITKLTWIGSGLIQEISTFEYGNGELIRTTTYPNVDRVDVSVYTPSGNRIIVNNCEYRYAELNSNGFPVKISNFYGNSTPCVDTDENIYEFEYDANGNVIRTGIEYDDKKNPFYYCTSPRWLLQLAVDANVGQNNMITATFETPAGIESTYNGSYTYDAKTGFPLKVSGLGTTPSGAPRDVVLTYKYIKRKINIAEVEVPPTF